MRILFICSGHGIDDDRVSRKEGVSLTRLGNEVTVCAQKRLAYQEPLLRLVDVDTLEVMQKVASKGTKVAGRFQRALRLKNLYKLSKQEKPDLIVAHEFETGLLACWIKMRLGIPYVFDAHECFEETMPLIFPLWIRGVATCGLMKILRKVINGACAVTVATPASYSYSYAKDRGRSAHVLHNAPILEYFPYSEAEGDVPVIVHEGNLTFERGAMEILDALALVKEERAFTFLVLGTIPDEVMKPFEVKVGDLGMREEVDARGR